MLIDTIQIKNYKRLKNTIIRLSEKQNIFVGANNSGKTSAIEAISKFLNRKSGFSVYDFTITNWKKLNENLEIFMNVYNSEDKSSYEEQKKILENSIALLFPSLKLVIKVKENEIYHIKRLIPHLDMSVEKVAVTFVFEPTNYEDLFKEYLIHQKQIEQWKLSTASVEQEELEAIVKDHWATNFRNFLIKENRLKKLFSIKAYMSNPNENEEEYDFDEYSYISGNPLENIIKIDAINAQRGLSDANENGETIDGSKESLDRTKSLSSMFTHYFKKHINPVYSPAAKDYEVLKAVTNAKNAFRKHLEEGIKEVEIGLRNLGYPGFGSPSIRVSPNVNLIDSIQDEASILLNTHLYNDDDAEFYLPENYNGLGFQNLISMFFKLTLFKQERLKSFKNEKPDNKQIEPLHLIIIEEPEAHLHAQAQKVFINKAFEVLDLKSQPEYQTQLLISTHSTHITHNASFNDLLYFKRNSDEDGQIYQTEVINLRDVVLDEQGKTENKKFVEQYLKVYDHDLFFADGVILIEGAGERILLPKIIENSCPNLKEKYITILEMGGAHAHRFFPLLNALKRPTLIITDIDSVQQNVGADGKVTYPKIFINSLNENLITSNSTIKKWFADEESSIKIKELLLKTDSQKEKSFIKLVYQFENYGDNAYARTFEDAIAMTNYNLFSEMLEGTGLCKKFYKTFKVTGSNFNVLTVEKLFKDINTGSVKSNFALDLLFYETQENSSAVDLKTPKYIIEGLDWLNNKLN